MSTSPVGGDAFQMLNGQHATLLNPWFSKLRKGVCKGRVMGEDLDKEKGGIPDREEWLKRFEERSMEEIADELADNIDSEEFRDKCRAQLRNLLVDPLVTQI